MANSFSNYTIIRVTPTLTEDSAYADGDVLFTATAIPNAVLGNGGCSRLLNVFVMDQDLDTFGFDMFFTEKSTALGTIHATANISDANMEAIGLCGVLNYTSNVAVTADLDNVKIGKALSLSAEGESVEPMLIQADTDSRSVYVSGVLTSGTPTFADVDDLDLIFHIQYK